MRIIFLSAERARVPVVSVPFFSYELLRRNLGGGIGKRFDFYYAHMLNECRADFLAKIKSMTTPAPHPYSPSPYK